MSKPGGTSASNIDQLLDRSAPTLSVRPEPGIGLPAPGGSINPSVMLPHFRRGRRWLGRGRRRCWTDRVPMPPAWACRDAAPASVTGPARRRYVGRPLEHRRDFRVERPGAVRWVVAGLAPAARTPG